MGLKSKMKIFWSEHRDPILFYIIIVVVLIKGLNRLAGNRLNENEANNEIEISFQENKENKKLIDEFLEYCRNKQIEKAYDLISDKCKKEKYNTVSNFEKNYYNKMSEDAKIILVNILADNLIYLHDFEVVDKEVVKSISSLLLLFINYNTKTAIKEFDEFSIYEKKVLYSILIDGIASIYVDNEYLEYSDIGTKYKQKIIQELLSFFKYLTKFSKEKVFMIYTKEVKKYRMKEFNWDNIPY